MNGERASIRRFAKIEAHGAGRGRSGPVPADARDTFSDDIDAICRAVGVEHPIVMGQSQHGAMALEYASRHPEQVRGVVAVAPMPPAGSDVGLGSADAFSGRDAGPQRRTAHERDPATRRVPAILESSYQRSGHHPPYEQPDEFTADVVDRASSLPEVR